MIQWTDFDELFLLKVQFIFGLQTLYLPQHTKILAKHLSVRQNSLFDNDRSFWPISFKLKIEFPIIFSFIKKVFWLAKSMRFSDSQVLFHISETTITIDRLLIFEIYNFHYLLRTNFIKIGLLKFSDMHSIVFSFSFKKNLNQNFELKILITELIVREEG